MALNKKVLIIEDDALVAELIAVTLQHAGYLSLVAHSVEEGLRDFMPTPYDVVLTDIFMEGMGGLEGITRIRKLKPDVPIIAMSAGYKNLTPEKALAAAEKIGATMVLAKPLALDSVVTAVKRCWATSEPACHVLLANRD